MGASITSWADEMRSNGYSEQVMPAIFVGHGSPMNAIEENDFTRSLQATGKRFLNQKPFFVYRLIG